MNALNAIMDFIDQRAVVRRVAFFVVLAITISTILWSREFASTSPRPGMEVAAILAAIWGPLTALQGAIFTFYNTGRTAATSQSPTPTEVK